MKKLTTTLLLTVLASSAITVGSTLTASAATDQTSQITAKITGGALSLTRPNDAELNVTLTGQEQTVDLDNLSFDVTDARGLADNESGWTVTVASDNFDSYKSDYTLAIADKAISTEAVEVAGVTTKTVNKTEDLAAKATVSATASASDSEVANLQWTLAPSTDQAAE